MPGLTDVLAAARLIRLIRTDEITGPARELLIRWAFVVDDRPSSDMPWSDWAVLAPKRPFTVKLLGCHWCIGVYVAVAVLLARRCVPRAWSIAAEVLALAYAAAAVEDVITEIGMSAGWPDGTPES